MHFDQVYRNYYIFLTLLSLIIIRFKNCTIAPIIGLIIDKQLNLKSVVNSV